MTNPDKVEVSAPEKLSGFEWWRRSLQYRTGLGLDEAEKRQFEVDFQAKQAPARCVLCDEWRDWMLQYSPSVNFMMDHIRKLSNDPSAISKSNIICDVCDDMKGGGFHPEVGILLCSNWIRSKWQLEDILTHELVHAYDYLKFDVNLKDLKHHACTEIRASMLSGECRMFNEIQKTGLGNFGSKFQLCIRRRAVLSVSANPNCKDKEEAEKVVNSVWNSCFNDTRPFERIYR
ncbi:mitochondrial inner membrane protease ATP23 [Suhomyces tanzawaensis NRRL Y-17324]|uniref:Mitochondrial inner membrane protease ATP23 n=1 Tax=Suhomyces tanzawaensis NRRL Y-17324 TaxID=984487 RepID=A0A1E4SL04_9ASCO|nr:mitochondrial inner membrane protease ATP23 [Suhomyces tanzawaensis NRRL Y-17324]ODV80191.1 mitochondrial inner membrane protease ATP23 [Suhomyces tanzawaensis NRRL Y-17324]